jgi:hypothetical protein
MTFIEDLAVVTLLMLATRLPTIELMGVLACTLIIVIGPWSRQRRLWK